MSDDEAGEDEATDELGYTNLRYERQGAVVTITIDREKALNALDPETLEQLADAVEQLKDEEDLAGAILTGAGDKAFVAGADLRRLAQIESVWEGRNESMRGQAVLNAIEATPRPIIACINGYALGGGLELALACHFRYATQSAHMGLPEVSLGTIPGYGGTLRLTRTIGRGPATEMIVTGRQMDAAEALRLGLVNRVFETKAAMLAAAQETLGLVARNGPLAVSLALEAIDRGMRSSETVALEIESDLFGAAMNSDDAGEGIAAFLEKRKPQFKNQ